MWNVTRSPIPSADFLAQRRTQPSFRDALTVSLTRKDLTPAQVQLGIFSHMPSWVQTLMSVRNKIVGYCGFEVGQNIGAEKSITNLQVGDQAGFLTVIHLDNREIISFAEDRHMAFYISISITNDQATVSTMVNLKTWIGRTYMSIITPFHWLIARVVINNAVKAGRI